ncbi:MAG: AP2 domain-containing protein [Clostridia bacterium]
MGNKIDRTGEINCNTFGSEMIITEYRSAKDIDVYFSEYNWTFKNVRYSIFKNGNMKCPYERRHYKIGYLGEGEYKMSENRKHTKVYNTWHHMLERCYDKKFQEKHPTNKDCKISEEWHNFQNFGNWYNENYYEVEGEIMCLDKDILVKHNKIYSPDTCIFVPQIINTLFVKRDNDRGESCIGTSLKDGKYQVSCNLINPKTGKSKSEYLGIYDTELEAFEVYKYYKEKNIKQVADYYKEQIPYKLYNALYKYKVEIND